VYRAKGRRGLTFGGQNSWGSLGEVQVELGYLGCPDERKPMTVVARGKSIPGEPDARKRCAAGRGAESLTQSGGIWKDIPGSSDLPNGESLGDKSMSEKREILEGV
jgi:hypothetical protein